MSRPAEGGFARAALQSGCGFSAGLAEARALMAAGRPEEAESVLSGLTAQRERDERTLALVRAWNLFWTLDRPDEAEAVLAAGEGALEARASAAEAPAPSAAATPVRAPEVAELHALRARFAFAQGDPHAARAIAAPIEADAGAPEAARVRAAAAMAEALAVCGRRDEAVAVARRWEFASPRQLAGAQALAHWLAGSLYEA